MPDAMMEQKHSETYLKLATTQFRLAVHQTNDCWTESFVLCEKKKSVQAKVDLFAVLLTKIRQKANVWRERPVETGKVQIKNAHKRSVAFNSLWVPQAFAVLTQPLTIHGPVVSLSGKVQNSQGIALMDFLTGQLSRAVNARQPIQCCILRGLLLLNQALGRLWQHG